MSHEPHSSSAGRTSALAVQTLRKRSLESLLVGVVVLTHGIVDPLLTGGMYLATRGTGFEANAVARKVFHLAFFSAIDAGGWFNHHAELVAAGSYAGVRVLTVAVAVAMLVYWRDDIPYWVPFTSLLAAVGVVVTVSNLAVAVV